LVIKNEGEDNETEKKTVSDQKMLLSIQDNTPEKSDTIMHRNFKSQS